MATVKKVPYEYSVQITLNQLEAERLKKLLGSHTSGILTDLFHALDEANVEPTSEHFKMMGCSVLLSK